MRQSLNLNKQAAHPVMCAQKKGDSTYANNKPVST